MVLRPVPSYAPAFPPGKLIDHFPRVQHASPVTLENAFKRLFSRRVVFDGRAPATSFGLDYFPPIVRPSCVVSSAPCVFSYIHILEIIVDLYVFFFFEFYFISILLISMECVVSSIRKILYIYFVYVLKIIVDLYIYFCIIFSIHKTLYVYFRN